MKRLIVHADDLGADAARNRGIFEALESGMVTAASVLANGPAFEDCLRVIAPAAFRHISFGVHLNLTEGMPLVPDLQFITDRNGCFCGKREGHRRLMRAGDRPLTAEIRREMAAQVRALQAAGVPIDHLDGHQHVHVFPAAIDATIRTAAAFGIPWIRIPDEPLPESTDRNVLMHRAEARMFSRLAAAARRRIAGSALRATDHFRGLYLKGAMSVESLERTVRALPPGLTELMVHPGRAPGSRSRGPFAAFSHRDREKELEVLTGGDFRRMLEKYEIQLISFPGAGS